MAALAAAALPAGSVFAQAGGGAAPPEAAIELPQVEVVSAAPLSGSGLDRAKVPSPANVIRREDLVRSGVPSVLRALDEQVGAVAIDDAQGNRFSPNLLFRGFEASPLVGNPQGLAVYVNGTRFNQPFGDTTNWDLIPDVAVDRIELLPSNPAFGLNALGGTVTVRLRDGFSFQGGEIELAGGSFGRRQASVQYGLRVGNVAAYVAGTGLEDDSYRDNSPTRLRQLYGTLGWRGDRATLDFDVQGAQNHLSGLGTAPVQLLEVDRSAIFTQPDQTRNSFGLVRLRGTYDATDKLQLQGALYLQSFSQRTRNGDAADIEPCDSNRSILCFEDGPRLTTRNGATIPNFYTGNPFGLNSYRRGGPYALLNETGTDTTGFGASVQGTHRSELFGRPNRLVVGASYDGGRSTFSARTGVGALGLNRAFLDPSTTLALDDRSLAPVRVDADNDYYGVYATDVLDVTDKLSVTLAGRVNVADIRLRDRNGGDVTGSHAYARFNPAVGATYAILPNLSAYAGYSEANRAPSPAELACADPLRSCTLTNFFVADPSLKQVVARSVELGVRGRFGAGSEEDTRSGGTALEYRLGLFRTENSDDILFTQSAQVGRGYFRNVGDTLRQGVEASLRLRAGPLTAYAEYSFTDATFQTAFTTESPNNPFADRNGLIQVRPGNRLPGVPAHLLKLGASLQVAEGWTIGITGLAASGRVLRGDESNQNPHTQPYFVVGFNTAWQVTKNFQVFAAVQNAFNRDYATFGAYGPTSLVPITQVPGASNPRQLVPAPPVAAFGGVRVRF